MPSFTRRHALYSVVGALGVVSGCGTQSRSQSSPTPTPRNPRDGAVTDLPSIRLRNPGPTPVLTESEPETTSNGRPTDSNWGSTFITDTETAASLEFAAVEGVARAERFFEETEFDSETVYVEQHRVQECYERELCWVRWTESSIETAYSTGYRDADVACETDAYDAVAQLVRLPIAFDADDLRRQGSRTQSGPCRPPTSPETPEETE